MTRSRVPADTSAEADGVQIDAYCRMGGPGRVAVMFRLGALARKVAMAGIRHRHPDYDEASVRLALARLLLGDDAVRRVWPDRELVEP